MLNTLIMGLMIMYFIAGILTVTAGLLAAAADDEADMEQIKAQIRKPLAWVCYIACAIFWPAIIGYVVYDSIRIIRS